MHVQYVMAVVLKCASSIYRPTNNICGFSRETLVEMTTNIESQEFRRRENDELGCAEHPRAGGTDDLDLQRLHRHEVCLPPIMENEQS